MLKSTAKIAHTGTVLPSVSLALVLDLLQSLRKICSEAELDRCLQRAGIVKEFLDHPSARLTHDQLVKLYQESVSATGDEMMGLWSRPIRTGTLKYLIRAVMDAPSINVALYRFTQFWNLLLDDYRLNLSHGESSMILALVPRSKSVSVNRFGHALMLKLTHGIVSWLVGREVGVLTVAFSFARPAFAADYPILFPAPIGFEAQHSTISFPTELAKMRGKRSAADVRTFLEQAPRDWIFTIYREHAVQLKVRELLYADLGRTLEDVSCKLNISSRTLIRKLHMEQLTFQDIKDDLRRDLAILHLARADASLGEIAYALGFSSPAVFQRAFRQWIGITPGMYRAAQQQVI
ncbi:MULTISPECIES: AraC family transcriptional regulator [unclassified Burkholderia]|uniref:AraC family transcriptional regulator n=1 Tax=unclassified Burkholderia TaxID=2613784 RepID=UPI002ABE9D3D|nr:MULTISPECIES: AraC family transcriptional regulator ligand-binding domain-containing protein [unclassified Burkholderia]